MTEQPKHLTVFGLYEDRSTRKLVAAGLLPENTRIEEITAAWAYAVMYSAKGLTIPDYEAAVALLKKRHPSWEMVGYEFVAIHLDLSKANDDKAEV